ncbi:MAG: PQQ-binding-like beta-propeller repeat protein, partial [Gemmatimonadales bacterium]
LYTYSVVELDARLGTLKRWQQLLQGDDHDWDLAAAPSLVRTAGGRRLIAQGGKDGRLYAIHRRSGTVRWRYRSPTPLIAGVTSTAGGLVFTGDLRGEVLAFDGRTGAVRWQYATGQPIGGGVVTYLAGGRQYVAAAVGMHAPTTWRLKTGSAKVVVFAVPRKSK